jgi:hypothetical protein
MELGVTDPMPALNAPAMAPAVEGLGVHPCGTGDFSHAFTVGWAHPLADLSPQLGVVRRLHQSWLGPLVDRSDRADNIAGSGGLEDLPTMLSAPA